jgi:hypothetical protein
MRAALTMVVGLTAAALLAAPALAGPRDFRVGVTDRPLGSSDIAGMGRANVETFRVNFSWVHVESGRPRPGSSCNERTATMPGVSYDWAQNDRTVRQASAHGVRLLPVIVGSPDYVAARSTNAPYTESRREVEAYKCFVRALVDRYGSGGDLPRLNPAVTPIKDWQVWNEPNLPKYATEEKGVSPREYADLVSVTSRQIRREDPGATIALAGLPVTNNGFDPTQFLTKLYRVRGIERKFDVIAVHPYARDHRGVKGAILRLREMLTNVRDRGRYIWVTETGWATHGSNYPFAVKGRRGQAKQLEKTIGMLKRNRREWNIGTVTWFRWRDQAVPSQNRGAFDYMGLYNEGGSPKPSCRSFTAFTNGRCDRLQGVSGTSTGGGAALGGSRAIVASPGE